MTKTQKSTPAERACARTQPPANRDMRATTCPLCGAAYLDYPDGRTAHQQVFGHVPSTDPDET